jgi:acyl-CoA synthetase (AMP-forming)/AMP-acid ligase II
MSGRAVPLAAELTIPGLLERRCAEHRDRTALVAESGERVTYGDLLERVRVAARALLHLGVEPGARVALWAPNSVEWVVTSLATAFAGAELVPLNTRWHVHEVLDLVVRSRCAVWFVPDEFLGAPMAASAVSAADGVWDGALVAFGAAAPTALQAWDGLLARGDLPGDGVLDGRMRAASPDAVSHVQFTSGTTGRPKGARLRHAAMVSTTAAWAAIVGLTSADRYPVVSPMSHIGGHKTGTLASLTAGAASFPVARFDARVLLELVHAESATVLQGPPTVFAALLDQVDAGFRAPETLRVAVTGSAVIPPALLRRMVGTLGVRNVHAGYGLTETTGVCTITRADDPLDLVAESSGRPIAGVEIRIVDPGGQAVPSGTRGEILVRGPGTMAGYLDDDDATREIVSADGWLSTGDVGWVDDIGNLRIVDRLKDMIIVGGFNTSPAEIERALEDHALVAQSAVVGMADDRLGEVPCAFVVTVAGADLDESALLAWAEGRLAGYKVPRRVEFVEELPLTAVGKVDKSQLSGKLR